MDDALRSRLHDLTLAARALLTNEARSLLIGTYGLAADGHFEPLSRLPAIAAIPAVAETRRRLERFVHDEKAAGRNGAEAVERLVKETAFTHLNRMVAFKLLEVRKLLRGAIDKGHSSNGYLFYLADHPDDEALHNAGDLPQDALGEGPRDVAYRHFLLWQCGQLAREVLVLFDADTLPSRLFPRPQALRSLLAALNAPDLRDAWAPGNEETVGWVYQYFNEQEKDAVFERLNKQKQKIRREDLPAATQLFTPRWIVEWLVQNTLGRQWLQMHPDSALAAQLPYLVPLAGEVPPAPFKLAREVTLLDPACGTMHFGLVAFDLFAAMYREELAHAGEEGWPARPSVSGADAIPAAILAHNLYGIDIDLRAVQLAALSLYLKAKPLSPKASIEPKNLVCADVTVLNGNRLGAFVDALGLRRPLVETAIRALWPRLKQAGEVGSLLRIEDAIRDLAAPARRAASSNQPTLPGMPAQGDDAGRFNTLTDLEAQIVEALNDFARAEAARGDDATAFVAGAEQGLRLLDLLGRRYDVVVANPPYLDSRDFEERFKKFIDPAFPEGKRNLYSAFILRCSELLAPGGRLGMITPLSFMFLSSFESLRKKIRDHSAVETLAHTGYRTFANVMVDVAFFVLRSEQTEHRRQNNVGTYFRLVREPDSEAKRVRFEQALALVREGDADSLVFPYCQGDFDAIIGAPWVYWVTSELRKLFTKLSAIEDNAPPRQGMATADNFRFLRYWWEIGGRRIAFNCASRDESMLRTEKWYPYMKGGAFKRWYGNQEYCVNYGRNGFEIKAWAAPLYGNSGWSRIIKSTEYYFKRGVTYSFLTQSSFNARISPGGFIFDVAGSSLFPPQQNIFLILAFLNSSFAEYALKLINPTVNFQVGDLARLPIPTETSETLDGLVERAIALAKQDSVESETTYDFVAPPMWPEGTGEVAARHAELASVEREIDEEVYRLYGIAGDDRRAIEAELRAPAVAGDDAEQEAMPLDGDDEAAYDAPATGDALARRWLSYALGVLLGRFQPGVEGAIGRGSFSPEVAARLQALADDDGIGLLEPNHPDDLGAKLRQALELMVGEGAAPHLIHLAIGGRSLHEYLARDFYRDHVRQYRKRPVYWLLQSPKRTYSLLLFHERLSGDSLPLILGNRYLGSKINALRGQMGELQAAIGAAAPGRQQRQAERVRDAVGEQLADAEAFAQLVRAAIEATNERGQTVGWRPAIDDGILLNLAPLHTLIPAWGAEPKKAWQALERGDYDWSHTAMRYWPDRVLAKCRTNKSSAIAHGIDTE